MLSKEERVLIGKQIVNGEITVKEAQAKYNLSRSAVQLYATDYRKANGLPVRSVKKQASSISIKAKSVDLDFDELQSMTKEELIDQLILAKANELRLKKGYEVKGVGANKEFVPLNSMNTK